MADITEADLEKAAQAMRSAKRADREARAEDFAELRRQWRVQEQDAGRRGPGPEA